MNCTAPRTIECVTSFLFCLADDGTLCLCKSSLFSQGAVGRWGLLVGLGAKVSPWFSCSLPLPSGISALSL